MKTKHLVAAGLAVLIVISSLGAGVSVLAAPAESTLLPYRTSQFHILSLPEPIRSDASYLVWEIADPAIEDESTVLRMGGGITLTSGSPLGAILLGTKSPTETPLMMGLVGAGEKNLQEQTCESGSDLDPEPVNDLWETLLVPEWAVTRGVTITLWVDDGPAGGAGEVYTITSEVLLSAPSAELVGILLPAETSNIMSAAESELADVWTPELENIGALVLGWKNSGPARGVGLINAGIGVQSLQVPPCDPIGGEWANDPYKPWLLVRKDQVLAAGHQPVVFSENDLPGGEPGFQFELNIGAYRPAFLKFVYLPLINR